MSITQDEFENPGECDVHGTPLVWAESGDAESGPTGLYLTCLACEDEHAPKCPECGLTQSEGFEHKAVPTRNYGGGFDTYERCPRCNYREVFV